MYHCLIMHVYQSPGDIFELSGGVVNDGHGSQWDKHLQARIDSHSYAP